MFSSEEEFLTFLDSFFPKDHSSLDIPRGDDCAVLKIEGDICVSTDLFLEDVHFKLDYFSPEDIGYKALAVNISDICAMGATPEGFFLNLIFPHKIMDKNFWNGVFYGMSSLSNSLEMVLAGGYISKGPMLGFGITVWGRGKRYLKRQAEVGDLIFVTGELGLARVGLMVLENYPELITEFPESVNRFLRPPILLKEANTLALYEGVRSLMDVSDGLIKDLKRLVGPEKGVRLFSDSLDIHEEVKRFSSLTKEEPLKYFLLGGEDYALLGTLDRNRIDVSKVQIGISIIGEVIPRSGIWIGNNMIKFDGYDHFSKR